MLTFYLNGQLIKEEQIDGDMTVLRYLRTHQSLTGTKEGCASGDCGACTILIGSLSHSPTNSELNDASPKTSNDWQYSSANSCITFVTQLEGKSVVTVEALAEDKQLHPAQQAIVDHHGSQCGFCTPGFVMSMAALYEQHAGEALERAKIEEALSGNLCRCTGYRPIIDASQDMLSQQTTKNPTAVKIWQPDTNTITAEPMAGLNGRGKQSWVPRTEKELQQLLSEHPNAQLVAGATDIALQVTQAYRPIQKLISLNNINSLKQISQDESHLTIGAAVTYSDIENTLQTLFPEFGLMLKRLGSKQIRNQGTIGGNIANASPIGDTPPVLIALDAEIELANAKGSRWLPLESFFKDYKVTDLKLGEYLRNIRIPLLKNNEHLKVYKISKRLEDDISAVLFAAKIGLENNCIQTIKTGFGGMAGIPKSASATEKALLGKSLSLESFMEAAEQLNRDFTPLSDVRASADYRMQVAKGLMQKCVLELLEPEALSRIESIHNSQPSNVLGTNNLGVSHA